ncbi:hypothetical protein EDB81DRAFT_760908 [Dactylonectria macrodidyma]|uniref:Uncharacterized protein n=1 Tax=Dactylonectria macrodidyma TaxID=307937 RepID=A0A9P9EQI5_9HYPO|nr:hypothetical protein EDB81DRAFT_760908 [Dactylonectria macrodidyma]
MDDVPSFMPSWFSTNDFDGGDEPEMTAFIDWDGLHHHEVNDTAYQALTESCDSAVRSSISPSYPDNLDISSKTSLSHKPDSDVSEVSIGFAEVKLPIIYHDDPTSPVSSNESLDIEYQEHEKDQEKPRDSRPAVQPEGPPQRQRYLTLSRAAKRGLASNDECAEDELVAHDVDHNEDHHEDHDVEDQDVGELDLNEERVQERSGDVRNNDPGDQDTQAHLDGRITEDLNLTGAMRIVLARARRICRKRRRHNHRRLIERRYYMSRTRVSANYLKAGAVRQRMEK